MRLLEAHDWPGNVRQLENVVRRALVVSKGEAILPGDLPPEIAGSATSTVEVPIPGATVPASPAAQTSSPPTSAVELSPADLARQLFRWARAQGGLKVIPAVERELVIEALKETGNNQVKAARLLGITRATLRKRIERFGIKREIVVE